MEERRILPPAPDWTPDRPTYIVVTVPTTPYRQLIDWNSQALVSNAS